MTIQWSRVDTDPLPEEGVEVAVISPGGIETILFRQGNLWFIPGASMYTYWTPMFWRAL